jgi:cell shape-determining protein MreC
MPEEILWKATVAFGALLLVVFGGVAVLRILPHRKSRVVNEAEREALEDLQGRLGELDQLQERVRELEERLDFAERILAKQRDGERLAAPKD